MDTRLRTNVTSLGFCLLSTHGTHSVFDNDLGDDGERAISDANAKRATPLAKLRMGDY